LIRKHQARTNRPGLMSRGGIRSVVVVWLAFQCALGTACGDCPLSREFPAAAGGGVTALGAAGVVSAALEPEGMATGPLS
jgi:hypothetical protein